MSLQPLHLTLPDLLAMCPWEGSTNPYYETAGSESAAWASSHNNVLTDRKRAHFVMSSNELLASHTYPYAGYGQFRTVCDFLNILFLFDEISDDQTGDNTRVSGELFVKAMSSDWDDGSPFSTIAKEFRGRFLRLAGPNSARRFLDCFHSYVEAVSKEADLRYDGKVLDLDSYIKLRRENSAVRLGFGLIEPVLGIDLPDEVLEDPNFKVIYWAGVDGVCWANDLYSYKMERAMGHGGNNILTVLMNDKSMDLQAASDCVGVLFKDMVDRYMLAKTKLPSWGPAVDENVARYVEGIGHWLRGNLEWSFESQRYFGADHLKIRASLTVTLQPLEGYELVAPADVDAD